MKFLRHVPAAALLLLMILPGCAPLVQAPRVALNETSLVGLDAFGIDLDLHLGITNPNTFDLSLLSYTFDLRVLALPLSTGGKQETILFPAGKETGMRVPVRLGFSDLLEITAGLSDPDTIPYQLNAMLQLKTPLGQMAVPVEKSALLSVPERFRPAAFVNRMQEALRSLR